MSRIDARRRNASALRFRFSQSLASLRHRPSHANGRSTIHRLRQDDEPLGLIGALDDFDVSRTATSSPWRRGNTVLDSRRRRRASSRTDTCRTSSPERTPPSRSWMSAAMHDGVDQQALRIDENVALLALDLLSRIVTVRIDGRPPFSALFTLWLSMMAAVGLASRSPARGTSRRACDGCAPACRPSSTGRNSRRPCFVGGKSFGIARHWQPVDRTYISPFTTSRMSTVRLPPPRLAGGINGSTAPIPRRSDRWDIATCCGRNGAVFRRPHRRPSSNQATSLNHK